MNRILLFIIFQLIPFPIFSQVTKLPKKQTPSLGSPIADFPQNKMPAGVTVLTTRRGEGIPGSTMPRPETPRYKMRYEVRDSIKMFTLYFREYIDGVLIHDDLEIVQRWVDLKEGDRTLFEMAPEFTAASSLKVFFNFPSGFVRCCYMNSFSGKCVKIAYFEMEEVARHTFIPLLLMYEDTETGEVEQVINNYLKDTVIPVNEIINKELLSKLSRYKLVYYDIVFK
ncbi:MAG: hypothetical protein LUG98_14190 [Tannerellaceae bacterium]|nr:hypothetical protein [Tannerellaceae bacterium]